MTTNNPGPIIAACLVALIIGFFFFRSCQVRASKRRTGETIDTFGAEPLEARGLLCYTTNATPNTLIIARQPADAPTKAAYLEAPEVYPIPPTLLYNDTDLYTFLIENTEIREFRFLHSSGEVSNFTIRRGNTLSKDLNDYVKKVCLKEGALAANGGTADDA